MFSPCQNIQNYKKSPPDDEVMTILVRSLKMRGFEAVCRNQHTDSSDLLANRFKTGQFLVKTALFGPFDQNTSKHMTDPSADTLAENDQNL